jgi:hypothetical protein
MKIKVTQDLSAVSSWEDLRRFVAQTISDIVTTLNGRVDLVDNCETHVEAVTFGLAGQEVAISHKLGRIPSGYVVVRKSNHVDIYDGTKENTSRILFVRADAVATVTLLIF